MIVLHGATRDAASNFDYVMKAAAAAGDSNTIIVAPLFATETDITNYGFPKTTLYWSSSGWKQGDQSLTSPLARPFDISSFEVVDLLIRQLGDPGRFPNQRQITVIGHSAGGQFAVRYAATNRVERSLPPGITLRYGVANPSSYIYMDGTRANASGTFTTPANAASCPSYNSYRYGVERLAPYAAAVGAATIRQQFASRRVAYLLGTLDTDPAASDLDVGCPAAFQGEHRLERGENFFAHLGSHYGSAIYRTHSKHLIAGVGHSTSKMLGSAPARQLMFAGATATPETAPAVSPAVAKLADDTFDRTVNAGWGTTQSGDSWAQVGGVASHYGVWGGAARHNLTTADSSRLSVLSSAKAVNVDVRLKFRLPQMPVGGNAYVYAVGRFVDSRNYWRADVRISPRGVVSTRARSVVNGSVATRIGYRTLSRTYRAGEWWTLRMRLVGTDGTTVRVKTWRHGTSQPRWQASGTFRETALDRAAAVGVRSIAGRKVTNTLVVEYTRFIAVDLNR